MTRDTIMPTAERRAESLVLYRGPWLGVAEHQLTDKPLFPFFGLFRLRLGNARLHAAWHGLAENRAAHRRMGESSLQALGAGEPRRRAARLPCRPALPVPLGMGCVGGVHVGLCRDGAGAPADGGGHRLPDHSLDPARRHAGRADCRGRPGGVQQLSRHVDRDDRHLLRLGPRPVRHAWPGGAGDRAALRLGSDARPGASPGWSGSATARSNGPGAVSPTGGWNRCSGPRSGRSPGSPPCARIRHCFPGGCAADWWPDRTAGWCGRTACGG